MDEESAQTSIPSQLAHILHVVPNGQASPLPQIRAYDAILIRNKNTT
jgi:hypothetical protein